MRKLFFSALILLLIFIRVELKALFEQNSSNLTLSSNSLNQTNSFLFKSDSDNKSEEGVNEFKNQGFHITSCPKSFKKYCLNQGECYLKLYKSDLIELNSNLKLHSAVPKCRCGFHYILYGLILISYSGDRCEFVNHSLTYLSIGLSIFTLLLVVLLIGLVSFMFKSFSNVKWKPTSLSFTHQENANSFLKSSKRIISGQSLKNSWKNIKIKRAFSSNKLQNHCKKSDHKLFAKPIRKQFSKKKRSIFRRYACKRTRHMLRNVEMFSFSTPQVYETYDNFIFVNHSTDRKSRFNALSSLNSTILNNLFSYGQDPTCQPCMNRVEIKCNSNVFIYPKPSRSTSKFNRFSCQNEETKEPTIENGSLFY